MEITFLLVTCDDDFVHKLLFLTVPPVVSETKLSVSQSSNIFVNLEEEICKFNRCITNVETETNEYQFGLVNITLQGTNLKNCFQIDIVYSMLTRQIAAGKLSRIENYIEKAMMHFQK